MRSDVRALLKIFGGAAVLVALVFGVLVASVLGGIAQETAIGIALAVFVGGSLLLAVLFGRGLFVRDAKGAVNDDDR